MQSQASETPISAPSNFRLVLATICAAALWSLAYAQIEPLASWLVTLIFGLEPASSPAEALQFFIYDSIKILLLLIALIYAIAFMRASLNLERVRNYLTGKKKILGYFLGALFGSITPFCSCSSIPLFLGFTTARIPFGVTMAFLITSPLINEMAVVLLWGLLGWKLTLIYIGLGVAAGIIGGCVMDAIGAERWLTPYFLELANKPSPGKPIELQFRRPRFTWQKRHDFALQEMKSIFKRAWKWVLIGVAIGAALHGYVPDNWFATHFSAGEWWTVPAAVGAGIPLYSNVTGIVPVMESLLLKGLPIGTTLAFCMSAVAASIPEVLLLRQIMTLKLQAAFLLYLWLIFTLAGWLFNCAGPWLI
ncbi:MAG: permease [Desulfovibrio sp.]|nr:permease [Desulfovibrio sp.]